MLLRGRPDCLSVLASALFSADFLPFIFNVSRRPLLLLCLICVVFCSSLPSRIRFLVMGVDVLSLPIRLPRRSLLYELIRSVPLINDCVLTMEAEGPCFVIELSRGPRDGLPTRDVLIELMRLLKLMFFLWSVAGDFTIVETEGLFVMIMLLIRDVLSALILLPRLTVVRFPTDELTPVGVLLLERLRALEELCCLPPAPAGLLRKSKLRGLWRTGRREGVRLSIAPVLPLVSQLDIIRLG